MDNIEGMKLLIPDNSIDLTVTSPPYDGLRTYNGYSFDFEAVAKELYRITKDGGVVVWVVGDSVVKGSETGTSFRQALYFKEIGFNLHDTMIYAKNNPVPLTHKRYEQQFEYMFILTKGKIGTFNGIKEASKSAGMPAKRVRDYSYGVEIKNTSIPNQVVSKTRLKYNIWYYTVGNGSVTKDKIAHKHPAIFPEQLAEDHILTWSNEGDIVLDPFMGSGTTAKMAMLNNRNYIGFDSSQEYVDIAIERINNHLTG